MDENLPFHIIRYIIYRYCGLPGHESMSGADKKRAGTWGYKTAEDIDSNFTMCCKRWKEYLSAPSGHMAYLVKRGELQVLVDLHTRFADLMLAWNRYDDLIQSCQYMLSIWKDSGTVKLYLARAYALKGDSELAVRCYRESADMLKYEYPQTRRDGTDSGLAHRERVRIREEMKQLGLDARTISSPGSS